MRALVTGSRGFVGRHITAELRSRGWFVGGIDYFREGWTAKRGHASISYMDSRDDGTGWDMWGNALGYFDSSAKAWDLIVHAAYHVGGRAVIDGGGAELIENEQLDADMFAYAIRTQAKHVLYFSSSAVYPVDLQGDDRPGHPLREDAALSYGEDRYGEYSPWPDADYGWAKMNGERLADVARRNGVPVTVVRPFSGYGADQSPDYPFPKIIERVKAWRPGETLKVFGDPASTRDWIHIDDVVKGALAVYEQQHKPYDGPARTGEAVWREEPVNLCTGEALAFGFLIQKAWLMARGYTIEQWGGFLPPSLDTPMPDVESIPGPTGVFHRVGDPTRMLTYYRPTITIEQGIREALRGA